MRNLEQFKALIKKMAKIDGDEKAITVMRNLHKNNIISEKIWEELSQWIEDEFFGKEKLA